MKTRSIAAIALSIALSLTARAQVPGIINYQGRVTTGGTNFNGTGQFKFALVDNGGATTYWSNGANAVSLTVTKGLYSVPLGDTGIANMDYTMPTGVFTNSDVRLRVWFNDGVNGSQQLSPDQRIGAVGYALAVANVKAVGNNTFVGDNAGNFSTTAFGNTAIGAAALSSITSGGNLNTAIGYQALQLNTNGADNTANGYAALYANTSGSANTANGYGALGANTSGDANTANGAYSLSANTNGLYNCAFGFLALSSNTNGFDNTAIGFEALSVNKTGHDNIAIGANAGLNITNGSQNIDIGSQGVGDESGIIRIGTPGVHTTTVLSGNVGVGTNSPAWPLDVWAARSIARFGSASDVNGSAIEFKTIAASPTYLGVINFNNSADSYPGQIAYLPSSGMTLRSGGSERMRISTNGNVGVGTTAPDALLSVNGTADKPGGGSWSTFSDVRLKKNIEPLRGALDRLLELRAVTFEYKDAQSIHELPGVQIGMIAQEVEKVFPDWVDAAPNGMKRLSIHGFEALTVEALRELREEKDAKIAELRQQNAALAKRLAEFEGTLEKVSEQVERTKGAPQQVANVREHGGM